MLRFFARRRYLAEVRGLITGLLVLYPKGTVALFEDYPNTTAAIKANYDNGLTSYTSAVYITASISVNLIEMLGDTDKGTILQQLRAIDFEFVKHFIAEFREGRSVPLPEEMMLGTIMFGAVLIGAFALSNTGKIEEGTFDLLTSEIRGALSGLSGEERLRGRLIETVQTPGRNG